MHRLTAAHRRQLLALRAATIRDLRLLWLGFDPNDPDSWERFARPAAILLTAQHAEARRLGIRYYERLREAHNVRHINEVTLPPMDLPAEQVTRSMAATGLAGTFLALRAGKPMQAALDNGFVRASMAAGRLTLKGSRDAITAAAGSDAAADGWIRQTGAKPCSWCQGKSGIHMTSSEVFQAHDGCSCVAEPTWA